MPPIRSSQVPALVLLKFYHLAMHGGGSGFIPQSDFDQVRPFQVSTYLVGRACDELRGRGHLDANNISQGGNSTLTRLGSEITFWQISDAGIRYVEKLFDLNPGLEDATLTDDEGTIAGILTNAKLVEPASVAAMNDGDSWEPLIIERQEPAYAEALAKTETAVKAVRSDNGYAATQPGERNEVVKTLETGVEALKNEQPSKGRLRALLGRPLRYLADKFAGGAIGESAKQALEALIKWAGAIF